MANKIKIILALTSAILVPVTVAFLLPDIEIESKTLRWCFGTVFMVGIVVWIGYMMELVNKWNDPK